MNTVLWRKDRAKEQGGAKEGEKSEEGERREGKGRKERGGQGRVREQRRRVGKSEGAKEGIIIGK